MALKILYHGSPEIIRQPVYGKGKKYNDYGQGFYCTEHLELAKEWSCTEGSDGYANQYIIEMEDLRILNLSSNEYTILHWLSLLVQYRKMRISDPITKRGAEYLKKNFIIDLSGYDVIVGYRANDSYFSFARAFLANTLSVDQLSAAMRLGRLGEQYVLKTPKAFDSLRILSYEPVDSRVYYVKRKVRDEEARGAFRKELERDDMRGLYMRDIIQEGVQLDDPRIQQ